MRGCTQAAVMPSRRSLRGLLRYTVSLRLFFRFIVTDISSDFFGVSSGRVLFNMYYINTVYWTVCTRVVKRLSEKHVFCYEQKTQQTKHK